MHERPVSRINGRGPPLASPEAASRWSALNPLTAEHKFPDRKSNWGRATVTNYNNGKRSLKQALKSS